ncbi:MAG: hypothetical protein K2W96_13650 [Gemmataceae bacterium]|nr:hypothetical protein [Gemmataceae bacterium]
MRLDLKRVRENAQRSATEDLLDRVTVYRQEMEPEAVLVIEDELERRGVGADQRAAHGAARAATALVAPEGGVVRCFVCERPAMGRKRGWFRLFGLVPLFPVWRAFCDLHGR